MIDADVTELIACVPLPAGADMLEVVLRQLERIFLEDGGLAQARPGVRIPVSRPAHYLELLENIQVHGYHGMRKLGRVLEDAEIAGDWYNAIWMPTQAAIEHLGLARLYRDAPPGDLFLVLHRHRRDAFPRVGLPAPRADRRLGGRRPWEAPPAAIAAPPPIPGLVAEPERRGRQTPASMGFYAFRASAPPANTI